MGGLGYLKPPLTGIQWKYRKSPYLLKKLLSSIEFLVMLLKTAV